MTSGADHLHQYSNATPVYTVSNTGDTSIAGTLNVLNATLKVEPRLVSVHNVKVSVILALIVVYLA